MTKVLMKGNEALGEAAIRAGCVHFFGYPITPQTEVPEYLVKRLPEVGGVFLQAESEIASINMIYGAAGVGVKCLTSSSSPGISLMAEGLSYIAACELPCVVINIMRAGPGLGGILPAQSDYFQATRGHGHGDYQLIVLAPSSVQESVDLMMLAFELSEKYRNPAMICADGMIGQMMEPVEFACEGRGPPLQDNDWALTGCDGRERRIVNSLYLTPEENHARNVSMKEKYDRIAANEQRWELYKGDEDYDLLVVAFGTMARICKSAIDEVVREGLRVALFRPITLNPFPFEPLRRAMDGIAGDGRVLNIEMSMGQLVYDVKLAAEGSRRSSSWAPRAASSRRPTRWRKRSARSWTRRAPGPWRLDESRRREVSAYRGPPPAMSGAPAVRLPVRPLLRARVLADLTVSPHLRARHAVRLRLFARREVSVRPRGLLRTHARVARTIAHGYLQNGVWRNSCKTRAAGGRVRRCRRRRRVGLGSRANESRDSRRTATRCPPPAAERPPPTRTTDADGGVRVRRPYHRLRRHGGASAGRRRPRST